MVRTKPNGNLIDDDRGKNTGRHDVEKSHLLYTFSLLRRLVAQTWKMSPTYSRVTHNRDDFPLFSTNKFTQLQCDVHDICSEMN